jgi:hypothetical protein
MRSGGPEECVAGSAKSQLHRDYQGNFRDINNQQQREEKDQYPGEKSPDWYGYFSGLGCGQ